MSSGRRGKLLGAAEHVVLAHQSPPPRNGIRVLVGSETNGDRVFQKVEHLFFPFFIGE
jgi:hypothetical protein